MKHIIRLLMPAAFILLLSTLSFAQSPNSSYVIESNDWLSKIAKTAYGDATLYTKIIDGTNQKAANDNSFQKINSAGKLTVGQKVWIPSAVTSSTTATTTTTSPTSTSTTTSKNTEGIPETNCDIRLWYNYQVVAIGKINERWEQAGVPLKKRAEDAFEIRHHARINARFMMQDKSQVKGLQDRDQKKYGNPDGPTFDYLIKKNTDKGKTLEEAYQSIIDSSSRTDRKYNNECK